MEWINQKSEKPKSNIMINAEIFMGTLFIQTRETTERTWLCSEDPLKQEQVLFYQADTFELDSVQYTFDQDTKPSMFKKTELNYRTQQQQR